MASVQTPLKLPFTSAKLPRNIYCPFAVYYGKGKPAVFLPQVLWPDKSSHHRKMLQDELKSLRTDHNTEQATTHEVSDHASLLTYSLHLPYVLKFGMTGALPPHDMLYYMEAFFGNCMVDRTGVLTRCASVKILDPIPALDPAFRKEFPEICMERAREIHARAAEEGFGVKVLWSGGIDSTTALVALIKSASPRELTNITVLLTKASIAEYRLFYRKFLVSSVRTQLITDLSNVYKMNGDDDGLFLVVTGELGDQIFGSMYMKLCYVPPYRFNRLKKKNVFSGQLFAPWREFMPEMLVHYGAIPPTAAEDWLRWIEPQVARAPIPIVSTYDMLWWINYSLKWQHVSLRIVNAQTKIKANMFKRTEHFFRSDDFQQWSFHNHSDKIADYNDWTTYKAALKDFIYDFTADEKYRKEKVKEPSLRLVTRSNSNGSKTCQYVGLDENLQRVSFGFQSICVHRLKERYGCILQDMMVPATTVDSQIASTELWSSPDADKVVSKAFGTRSNGVFGLLRTEKKETVDVEEVETLGSVAGIWAFTHKLKSIGIFGRIRRHLSLNVQLPGPVKLCGCE